MNRSYFPALCLFFASIVPLCLPPHAAAQGTGTAYAELSPEAEASINRALRFLAATQNPDGSWGKTYQGAETSVALMAFMVQGHFPGDGPYGEAMTRGTDFLIQRGRAGNGYLGDQRQGMYEHGLATLALSEIWGQTEQDGLEDVLKAAVQVIFRAQNGEGGWRYDPKPTAADLSVTVMQIVALNSAKEAGVLVPDDVLKKATNYVLKCRDKSGGFNYMPGRSDPGFARTAAGVMSLQMAGQGDSDAVKQGIDYLLRYGDKKFNEVKHYHYGHYYAIQCMYQNGDATYEAWYPKIRDALLRTQGQDGGWPGGQSGTTAAYSTSMSVLILGVPYRFLPIYQR